MRVAVTGANGFIGRALCDRLRSSGHEVVPLVRRRIGLLGEVVVPDLMGEALVDALVGCDTVVHLAGLSGAGDREDSAMRKLLWVCNVDCSRAVAEKAARAGVRRMVYVSSAKVYGEVSVGLGAIPEDSSPRPEGIYAQSKLAAEAELCSDCVSKAIEVVIVRPVVVYGPGAGGNILWLVKLARLGLPLPFGAVRNGRSLVALDNVVDFLLLCSDKVRSPAAAGERFVISDGADVSTSQLFRVIARAFGARCRIFPVPVVLLRLTARLLGKGAVAQRVLGSFRVESSKAGSLLGWKPVISMEDQLRKMAAHDSSA